MSTSILGPDGEPIGTPETDLQADQQDYGARTVVNHVNTETLTPGQMKSYLQKAEGGDISAQAAMFDKMEEKDGTLDAHLRTRKTGVSSCDWRILPADESAEAEEAAELCRDVLSGIDDVQEMIFDLCDAISKGFAVHELDWETSANQWAPVDTLYRPQYWFQLADDGQTLRIDDSSIDGEELPKLNFLIHRVRARSGFDHRTGLMRSLVRAFVVRHYSWKDWMRFAEVYGMPPRIGRLRDEADWDSQEKRDLWNAVRSLGMDAAAVVRAGDDIELVDVDSAGEGEVFQMLLKTAAKEMVLAILGQTLTSGGEEGGSYALGQVHNQVRWDLIESDARSLERTLTEQLLRPLVRLNIGEDAPVPRWSFALEKPENLGELADSIKTLVEAGANIPERWVRDKYGYPETEDDETTLVPIQLQQARAALGGGGGEAANADSHRRGTTHRDTATVNARARDSRARDSQAASDVEHQTAPASATEGPVPKDGLAFMREKTVVDEESWNELSKAGKQKAWWITGVSRRRTAMAAQQLIDVLQNGETQSEYLNRLEELGISTPGSEEPGEGQITAPHARMVYRQNLNSAYGADRWISAQRTKSDRPFAQYHAVGDGRTRPNHLSLDGIVKPIDDPFWSAYWPPWALNCRCSVTTLSQSELDDEGLSVANRPELAARYQAAQVVAGDAPNPERFQRNWQNILPRMQQRDSIPDSMIPPKNEKFQFNRGDAYYLSDEGQEPETEQGRRDMDILRQFPIASDMV